MSSISYNPRSLSENYLIGKFNEQNEGFIRKVSATTLGMLDPGLICCLTDEFKLGTSGILTHFLCSSSGSKVVYFPLEMSHP